MSDEDWEKLQKKWQEEANARRGEILHNVLRCSPAPEKKEESGDHSCCCPC
ncbi:hypothetical protein KJ761_03655 [Patescibacteria group bacterium]|nr:hypothetical protein [Patescibacteria group bacterium]